MMLLALTVERYVSVCHPGRTQPFMGPPRLIVSLIPLLTFLLYLPTVFGNELLACAVAPGGTLLYQEQANNAFLNSVFYSVYKVILEVVFKVGPIVLLAGLNMRIMVVYRRSCERRRRMTLSRTTSSDEDPRKFAEERRLILLLGSTSILFVVCVSPMVILNVTLSKTNLIVYSYQVFRAIANLLEVTNYSITFYIYCMFSEDFRNTLLRTLRCPWRPGRSAVPENLNPAVTKQVTANKVSTSATNTTNTASSAACLPVPAANSHKLWRGLWVCSPPTASV